MELICLWLSINSVTRWVQTDHLPNKRQTIEFLFVTTDLQFRTGPVVKLMATSVSPTTGLFILWVDDTG